MPSRRGVQPNLPARVAAAHPAGTRLSASRPPGLPSLTPPRPCCRRRRLAFPQPRSLKKRPIAVERQLSIYTDAREVPPSASPPSCGEMENAARWPEGISGEGGDQPAGADGCAVATGPHYQSDPDSNGTATWAVPPPATPAPTAEEVKCPSFTVDAKYAKRFEETPFTLPSRCARSLRPPAACAAVCAAPAAPPADRAGPSSRYVRRKQKGYASVIDYDMDNEDTLWLEALNSHAKSGRGQRGGARVAGQRGFKPVDEETMELWMDKLEKDALRRHPPPALHDQEIEIGFTRRSFNGDLKPGHTAGGAAGRPKKPTTPAPCCVCWRQASTNPSNMLLACTHCRMRVHEECYGACRDK